MRFNAARMAAAALLLATLSTAAIAQDQAKPAVPDQTMSGLATNDATFDPTQPIKTGFVLSVDVSSAAGREQDLSGAYTVDPTGSIQIKLVGPVSVRGLTPPQAEDKVAAQLKPYIKDPKVAVAIISVPKPVVLLTGAVSRAGTVPVNEDSTLFELVATMGFSDNADLSHIMVSHRDEKGDRSLKEYNLLSWFKRTAGTTPDPAQNPVVGDRDYVYVPLKTLPGTGNVSVEGDVVRPGLVPIRVGVSTSLREALALAGGPNITADRREVAIRRVGVERPIVVDYDKMEEGDPIHNVAVQADDVVYVRRLSPDMFINMNGGFVRPGKLPYQHTMTLLEAIAEAGGLTSTAKFKSGVVYRHVAGVGDPTRTQLIAFNYLKMRQNKEADIRLEPGDTVEIQIGEPTPRLDPIQTTTSLLTIAFLVDRLFGGGRYGY